MDIQIYTEKLVVEGESVWLSNIDLSLLIGQLPVQEVLEALTANDQFSAIVDYISEAKKEEE